MRLEEVIKIKEDTLYHRYSHHPEEIEIADKISIEAMKYHLYRRSTPDAVGSPLLPGETKE